jgi:hypothetical protein
MNDLQSDLASHIIDLETKALERWGNGDPTGFLEITADDASYFDPFIKSRIDGKAGLAERYEPIKGQVKIIDSRIIDPRVQVYGEVAILTFRFESKGNEGSMLWNTTEVYRKVGEAWKIVHTHWALPQEPPDATLSE